jgi:hypothetical protein
MSNLRSCVGARRVVVAAAMISAVATSTAACGLCPAPTASRAPIDHPAAATEVVLRVNYSGGLPDRDWSWGQVPWLSVYGDGTFVRADRAYNGTERPAVLSRGALPDGALDDLLWSAQDGGLLGADTHYSAWFGMADAASTDLVIVTDRAHSAGADGLGLIEGLSAEESLSPDPASRARLRAFILRLDAALTDAPSVAFTPDNVRVYAYPAKNPSDASGSKSVAWPLPAALTSLSYDVGWGNLGTETRCDIFSGADASAIMSAAVDARYWWTSGGVPFRVIVRPLLPDEPATCT